jgi:hypothetical protein
MEKMYYNGREIVLIENRYDNNYNNITCRGCVLDVEANCVRAITPRQVNTVCCPKNSGKFYVFKFKESAE